MNRLDRRLTILRGKRSGAFDRDQYYLEQASRTRAARKVRGCLRRGLPVMLHAPRWSRVHRFLDDVSVDLSIGTPSIRARTLSLAPLKGLSVPQAWAWLVQAVSEFCELKLQEGPAWQAVSRRGFRHVMMELLARSEDGNRRCLLIHGLEHIHVEALEDLVKVFDEHIAKTRNRRFNLLLAGSFEVDKVSITNGAHVELPDFSDREALEALVEHHGPLERHRLQSAVEVVGGVPAVLDALADGGTEALSKVVAGQEQVWPLLGGLADEIRHAMDLVNSDDALQSRLEDLARSGPLPIDNESDDRLLQSGLVRRCGLGSVKQSEVRAPWFAELAMAM